MLTERFFGVYGKHYSAGIKLFDLHTATGGESNGRPLPLGSFKQNFERDLDKELE